MTSNFSFAYFVFILPLSGIFTGYWIRKGKYGWWRCVIMAINIMLTLAILLTAIFISPKLESLKQKKFKDSHQQTSTNINKNKIMEYTLLEQEIDLNDPVSGFTFSSDDDQIDLQFIDWRNRKITLSFSMPYVFTYRIANGLRGLPNSHFLEILDSDLIQTLRKDHSASSEEELHHYIISTNEDQWCEIVASGFEFRIKG